ncbi:MAG: SpoIIE family protein phosphatase [Acidobacteriaceae bacterium]|nr:SpoIIE family protein phosphatase [Acidobacteriaceae bacterium]
MQRVGRVPRPVLWAIAVVFSLATAAYSIIWIIGVQRPRVHLGINEEMQPGCCLVIHSIEPRSPAERAGLQPRDRIMAVNGQSMADSLPFSGYPFYRLVTLGRNGVAVRLTIRRPGATRDFVTTAVLAPAPQNAAALSIPQRAVLRLITYYPLLFLIVGVLLLLLRLEDPNAWLLTALFAAFIAFAPFDEARANPPWRGFAIFYRELFNISGAALFYFFFAVFPVSSPVDRTLPKLKWICLAISGALSLVFGTLCFIAGNYTPEFRFFGWGHRAPLSWTIFVYSLVLFFLGFASLIGNSVWPHSSEARRKTRVILWGTLAGFGPAFLIILIAPVRGEEFTDLPFWIWAPAALVLALMPASYVYAVVKDRVLEIPVLLKRSVRYLIVQRGFVVVTLLVEAYVVFWVFTRFSNGFIRGFTAGRGTAPAPRSLDFASYCIGLIAGLIFLLAYLQIVPRVTKRIDRAFFRGKYDARRILEDLARETRAMTHPDSLATLLETEISQALHPTAVGVYLEGKDRRLWLRRNGNPSLSLSPDSPVLADLTRRAEPVTLPEPLMATSPDLAGLQLIRPECLVPVLGRAGQLRGVVALGPRLSEEPYSSEDRRLLTSVASQAGVALENIRLAEEMAGRLEAERRANQEIEFAREVQARLFPQKWPSLNTLEYVGACIPARQVGGDYYDFLELQPGRVAFVLADIAGKGISGALLMANLQANLRSQYALALTDFGGLLCSVNRLFYETTGENSYATMFFGDYNDATRTLRYANCGHLPPLVLRPEMERVDRLEPTTTVVGLFRDWKCSVAEAQLQPGDILALYTDGVTEACDAADEEFGAGRLTDVLRAHRGLPVSELAPVVVSAVKQFSRGEQQDDITILLARCTA